MCILRAVFDQFLWLFRHHLQMQNADVLLPLCKRQCECLSQSILFPPVTIAFLPFSEKEIHRKIIHIQTHFCTIRLLTLLLKRQPVLPAHNKTLKLKATSTPHLPWVKLLSLPLLLTHLF